MYLLMKYYKKIIYSKKINNIHNKLYKIYIEKMEVFVILNSIHYITYEKEEEDFNKFLVTVFTILNINYSNYNQSFHYNIWLASGNSRLVNMLSELWNGLSLGLRTTKSQYAQKSQAEHKRIFSNLKIYNADGAALEMRNHILRSMNDILTRYE